LDSDKSYEIYFVIIGSVVVAVSLVALGFNIRQVDQERATLTTNLEQRASLLADSLKESVEPYYANSSQSSFRTSLQKVVDKFANRERLAGIALYDNKGMLLATSSGLPKIRHNTQKSWLVLPLFPLWYMARSANF